MNNSLKVSELTQWPLAEVTPFGKFQSIIKQLKHQALLRNFFKYLKSNLAFCLKKQIKERNKVRLEFVECFGV